MRQISKLFVILAFGSLFANVVAKRSLYSYCRDLSKHMGRSFKVFTDPQVAFNEAKTHLRSIKNVGMEWRHKLATAWEAVIEQDSKCGPHSAKYVWTIMDCAPQHHDELVTLDTAVRAYAIKCLVASFWDQQLKKALGSKDKSGLMSFVDENYIETYFEDNPSEPKIYFGVIEGVECCKAALSLNALWSAVEKIVGLEETGQLTKSNELNKVMRKYLFKPCTKYTELVDDLMNRAKHVARYHPEGEQVFISGLSLDFQYAIFRYKFCNSFEFNSCESKS